MTMEHDETPLPDLHEKIDSAVGHLTVIAQRLRRLAPGAQNPDELVGDAERLEEAMLLIAGLQQVIAWEPGEGFAPLRSAEGTAEQLRAMASIGPRPPAAVQLLVRAAEMVAAPPMIFGGADATQAIAVARQELAESAERLLQAHRRIGLAP
jgi:hypothetical protein